MATFGLTFHHDGKIPDQPNEDGGVHAPPPFHSIYHHEQSCGVRLYVLGAQYIQNHLLS